MVGHLEMLIRTLISLLIITLSLVAFAQQTPTPATTSPAPAAPVAQEFPVMLQQNVTAGKTAVGTKIKAKLAVATLESGTVIPRNAVFSGEVVESVAKTSAGPSRLAIRMDSAEWKNGTAPVKLYLTSWYYPSVAEPGQDLQYGPTPSQKGSWNGSGEYPGPKVYRPFPRSDSDSDSAAPDTPSSAPSSHRVMMKNIEPERLGDGTIGLVSTHSNIKVDRYTTYVLASENLVTVKPVK